MADKTFTFSFPLQLNSGGGIKKDETPDSQVRVLSHTEIGQRIDDTNYGFPPFAYEQEALGDELRRPITLVLTQRAIVEYIPDLRLGSIEVVRETSKRRLSMQIKYADRQRLNIGQSSQFGLGLEEG